MSVMGTRVQRREDPGFLTGANRYTADLHDPLLEGALHVHFVRSTMAHAALTGVDVTDAREARGVVAVIVAETKAQAADAAELVIVDYEPLEAVVDPVEAEKGEVLLFPEVGRWQVDAAGRKVNRLLLTLWPQGDAPRPEPGPGLEGHYPAGETWSVALVRALCLPVLPLT